MKSGSRPSVMSHNFVQVPKATIPRSSFDRSHGLKTTFDAAYLVPIYVDEALPGDTFSLKLSTFARLSTPLKPVMDNLFLDVFFFSVPLRLIWAHFVNAFGQQANPGDSISYLVPQQVSPAGGYAVESLQDYMGLPTIGQVGGGNTVSHSALHLRAYNLIWNEWFRDQNLQNSLTVDTGDGPDTVANYTLQYRGKRHDYFTSCLPWPQKGAAVSIPLGTQAPITSNYSPGGTDKGIVTKDHTTEGLQRVYTSSGSAPFGMGQINLSGGGPTNTSSVDWPTLTDTYYNYADLTNATAATINALRQAFQIQKLLERDARGGTRYTEIIRSHFGVTSPDARLQRPEYLGGGSTQINFTPIPQTSVSAGTGGSGTNTPQANLAAIGTHSSSGMGFTKSFTEHEVVIGLANVRSDLNYQQGMDRMWSRSTRYDFYWPAFAHIGEQAVLNQEIYCDGSGPSGNDGLTFGYQERYAEYRFKPSKITGIFKSTYAGGPLDIWHLAQKFGSLPLLNATFIQDQTNSTLSRVVVSSPQILFDAYFNLKCARPMPLYSVPGQIDRF